MDDILFGGSEQFLTAIMEPLRAKFPFKHWKVGEGEFLGKKLVQQESGEIRVCQQDYANMVECIPLTKERRGETDSEITESERKAMRGALGELTWLVVCSRPDLSAACSLLQQKVTRAVGSDLVEVNKLIATARDFSAAEIRIQPIPLSDIEMCAWSDASWANATKKKSQGGFVIAASSRRLRTGEWDTISLLRWKSFKQERQVASTLGAEMLSLSRTVAETKWMRSMWMEAVNAQYSLESDSTWTSRMPLTICLDSKPVFDHLHGQALTVRDKRLAIEMLLVKKEIARENVEIRWLPTYQMLADGLTKMNAPASLLRKVMREGKMVLVEDKRIKSWSTKKGSKGNDEPQR